MWLGKGDAEKWHQFQNLWAKYVPVEHDYTATVQTRKKPHTRVHDQKYPTSTKKKGKSVFPYLRTILDMLIKNAVD